MDMRVAVVTGANRGIGFEIARQLALKGVRVIGTTRDKESGDVARKKFQAEKLDVEFECVDVRNTVSVIELTNTIKDKWKGQLDILVNNAGVLLDHGVDGNFASVFDAKLSTVQSTFETNVLGPLLLSQHLIPFMKQRKYGRIVNMSSGMGQLSEMGGGYAGYRLSKTALNALTRILSQELKGTNILVNSMCPGWVKTDMGGPNATRSPEEGADTAVYLATLPDTGPTGGFFRDRQSIPW